MRRRRLLVTLLLAVIAAVLLVALYTGVALAGAATMHAVPRGL